MGDRLQGSEWVWKDGSFIKWEDATVHVLSLAVQFGSSVFEGIRAYETSRGPAIFRLHDHLKRLQTSCRTYRMEPSHSMDDFAAAAIEGVKKNALASCYIRPMVLRGLGSPGLHPDLSPIECYMPMWPWGAYLGDGALEQGVDVGVSSWNRPAPNTFPSGAKAAGNYNNSQLIAMEAKSHGYKEGIALGPSGLVSEGSGQNLFLVLDDAVITPIQDGTSLSGITRHAVIRIAEELGYEVHEQPVPREMLYAADELFFTGTATEVTPIRSVDQLQVGSGSRGPVTERIQKRYLDLVRGEGPDPWGWVTYVE
ncbi:MAG: branched-chain amino acid transaminase [Longimicrobiales bacterium]